jgi:hypothetical protein
MTGRKSGDVPLSLAFASNVPPLKLMVLAWAPEPSTGGDKVARGQGSAIKIDSFITRSAAGHIHDVKGSGNIEYSELVTVTEQPPGTREPLPKLRVAAFKTALFCTVSVAAYG